VEANANRGEKGGVWRKERGKLQTLGQFKRGGELRNPRLSSHNKYNVLATKINTSAFESEGRKEVRKEKERPLKEVIVKIGLERTDTQEGIVTTLSLSSGCN